MRVIKSQHACTMGFLASLLLGVLSVQTALAAPVLSIVAVPEPAVNGSAVALDIMMAGVTDVYAYQFTFSFDPAVLQATGVSEGSFLASGGPTLFDGGSVDNALGSISLAFDTLTGPAAGVSGTGVLEHISFNVVNTGISALTFSNALFLDSGLGDIAVQISNRTLTAVGVAAAVPEPGTYLLMALGLGGSVATRRRTSV